MENNKMKTVTETGFNSLFEKVHIVELPEFSGVRVMMLPVIIGDPDSLPDFVETYRELFESMCKVERAKKHLGKVGYMTVDEKRVFPEVTHRRSGLHVDGIFQGGAGGWGGGQSGGSWGSVGNGMLTVSNPVGCKAYDQYFEGWPGDDGECDHMISQIDESRAVLFEPNTLYWVDGLCVHESIPQVKEVDRQFVRLSLPSCGPWFEGYTVNPLGVMPTGEILPQRIYL